MHRLRFRPTFFTGSRMLLLLLLILNVVSASPARAQLGVTTVDGVHVRVRSIIQSGLPRDHACNVNLEFDGRSLADAQMMLPPTVLRAVDDTGSDLAPTGYLMDLPPPMAMANEFGASVHLRMPGPAAKAITNLEGEVNFILSANQPVLTNFMSHFDEVLHHPLLDQYQIKVTRQKAGLANLLNLQLRVEDPQNRVVYVVIQTPAGALLSPERKILDTKGSVKIFTETFSEALFPNARLWILIDTPQTSKTIHFTFNYVRLPRFDPPQLQTSVIVVSATSLVGRNYSSYFHLNFCGGDVPTSMGIRRLTMKKIEVDDQKPVMINTNQLGLMQAMDFTGYDHSVQKWFPLEQLPPDAKTISVEGEAELFMPTLDNGGIMEFSNVLAHPINPFQNDALKTNGVGITFIGRINFKTCENNWRQDHVLSISSVPTNTSTNLQDSLVFSVDDPDNRLVRVDFFDDKGRALPVVSRMISTETNAPTGHTSQVYLFATPPPEGTRLRLYVATPESLHVMPFKVENAEL